MSFVSHFYVLGLTSWTWTNPSIEELKSESPSKYTSLKHNPSKRNPKLKIEDVTWSPQCALLGTRTNKHKALSKQEVELDGWCVSNSSHCTENMFHIIHARVPYECCISFLCSWIWNLSALHNETHMMASILTSDHHHQCPIYPILSLSLSLLWHIRTLVYHTLPSTPPHMFANKGSTQTVIFIATYCVEVCCNLMYLLSYIFAL